MLCHFLAGLFMLVLILACDKDDNDPQGSSGKILFDTNRDLEDTQGSEVYVMNADGSAQFRLTNSTGFDTDAKWNKAGTGIIFASHRGGLISNIYIMDANGSNQLRLTDPTFGGSFPDISPDNSSIAYNSSDGLSSSNAGIYVMNIDGSNRTRLGYAIGDSDAEYSPDGSQIVFSSSRFGDNEIFVMDADGSNQVRLTNDPSTDFMPSWKPGGAQIVFVSFRNGDKGIYTMDSNGTNQNMIYMSPANEQPNDPVYSPDGEQIIFSINNRLNIMDADGTNVTVLPGTGYNNNPDWN